MTRHDSIYVILSKSGKKIIDGIGNSNDQDLNLESIEDDLTYHYHHNEAMTVSVEVTEDGVIVTQSIDLCIEDWYIYDTDAPTYEGACYEWHRTWKDTDKDADR